ncbi:DNA cytosine methyltransferase [Rhizobium aquaticum]|uniref:DNA cytosine methyltransferase n=1 Tax=Rhizobium aquaticum TaxID=1549636 RepID=UPI003395E3AC
MALYSQRNDRLNGLALCAGVGGLEVGLHIAEPGYRTVCYVEREVFPAATLVARMADAALDNAPVWDDVTTFDGVPWRRKVHLVTGGYPCQPFSFSGLRKGEDDPRHLWPSIRRIVSEVEPEWCFFENVEGHLSLGASTVIGDLRSMGFRVKAGLFSALECGASQIRRRVFIMAHADKVAILQPDRTGAFVGRDEVQGRPHSNGLAGCSGKGGAPLDAHLAFDESLRGDANTDVQVPVFAPAPHQFASWAEILDRRPDLQPEFFGLGDGLENRMDRSDAAGNGVVSLAAAYAWRTLKAAMLKGN